MSHRLPDSLSLALPLQKPWRCSKPWQQNGSSPVFTPGQQTAAFEPRSFIPVARGDLASPADGAH